MVNHKQECDRVVIAGGSGFLATRLRVDLKRSGYDTHLLVRRPLSGEDFSIWDGTTLGEWTEHLNGAKAVVNLVGAPVLRRWTTESMTSMWDSRIESTRVIGEAIGKCAQPPEVWINGSAVGYYGDAGEQLVDETSQLADHRACGDLDRAGFLSRLCEAWERAVDDRPHPATRTAIIRTGIPLHPNGGALKPLVILTRCFLGGQVGNGKSYLPWIHIDDWTRMVLRLIEDLNAPRIVNACSPSPVTNGEFMRELRRALNRPWSPPVPELAIRAISPIVGMESGPIFDSIRAMPRAALEAGFEFKFPELSAALRDLLIPGQNSGD